MWEIIKLGTGFRYLQDATDKRKIRGERRVLDNLEHVLSRLHSNQFPVTSRAAEELRAFAHRLKAVQDDRTLTPDEAKELRRLVTRLRPTFRAEALGKHVFAVTDKRVEVARLLDGMPSLLADGAFQRLPQLAQHDFAEAGKCLAFERPTAAAFHLMRAAEASVRALYSAKTGLAHGGQPWGPLTAELRTKAAVPVVLLNQLDNVRTSFRNPTQHPELIYTMDDAQDLLFSCVDLLNRISTHLPERA